MSRLAPIRALADFLDAAGPLPEPVQRAAEGLDRFLAGEIPSLEEALTERPAWSQERKAGTVAVIEERDRLLRQAAADFWPGRNASAQARELHRAWSRYRVAGWQRDRVLEAPPAARAGTVEGRLWAVLRLRDDVIGWERLRRILVASAPYSLPAPPATLGARSEEERPDDH